MKTTTSFFYIAALILIFSSCLQPPDYPDEPVIEFISLSKDVVPQGSSPELEDELTITIGYTDGDGDLSNNNNELDVFLEDSRDGQPTRFSLPFIPEQGTGNGISGEIYLNISNLPFNLCCLFDDKNGQDPCTPSLVFPTDTFQYTIQIADRAGNLSNQIITDLIILECK